MKQNGTKQNEMKQVDVLQIDAFTQTPFEGNPAGVVLAGNDLTTVQMQYIARELNCSETAFVLDEQNDDFRFRYFTPATEVALCGHATIATLHALYHERSLTGSLSVITNAGRLSMEIGEDGTAWMRQAVPKFEDVPDLSIETTANLLGIDASGIRTDIPIGLAYTGLWDLMVPVTSMEVLSELQPKFDGIAALNRQQGAASTHVYTLATKHDESTLHARDFSPAVGVMEDPHTGTASGALGAWLVHHNVLEPGEFVFEQGWSVGRPGFIHVSVQRGSGGLEVNVGGTAVTVLRGSMSMQRV